MKRNLHATCWIAIVLLVLTVARPDLATPRAQQSNRIGLVVRFGAGSLITRCVAFSESGISGYDLLMRSGLDIVAAFDSGQGAAICSIEDTGCPVESCLTCDAPNYWSYWHLVDGAWVYSQVGSSGHTVGNGDVEGWSWGPGGPPPVIPFDQICAPPATDTPPPPTSTDTPPPPTSTDTPAPPTATSLPLTPMVWFRLDENPITAGACTNVRWDTSNAQEVYIDGEPVSAAGSREVCPVVSQEYRLRLVSAAGEQTYTLVLGVTGAVPTGTFTPQPAAVSSTSPSPTTQPTPTASQPDDALPQTVSEPAPPPPSTAQSIAIALPSPAQPREAALSSAASPTPSIRPTHTPPASAALSPAPSGDSAVSPALPIGTIVFSLTAGGLLGWLISEIRRRG
jgi:hypothetical protein